MAKTKTRILTKEQVEAEVRAKLKRRKSMMKILLDISFNDLYSQGVLVSSVEARLQKYKEEAAKKINIAPSKIKIRMNPDTGYYWHGKNGLQFYASIPETEHAYENRVNKEISARMKAIRNAKAEQTRRKNEIEKKKREDAIKAIKYLGDEVYDIFKEINANV